jgi:serine/threonine protein kinase
MAEQLGGYELTTTISGSVLPCFSASRPARLGAAPPVGYMAGAQPGAPDATIWALGPVARSPLTAEAVRARLLSLASVRSQYLPDWLEAGSGTWGQREMVWVSAATPVIATLASPPASMSLADRLMALAAAARGAHALHERGQLHAAICPHAVALVGGPLATGQQTSGAATAGPASSAATQAAAGAVLAPPSLANGQRPLVDVGYPPLGYIDPQLLRGQGGRWSDIWALGATARYVATGVPPYPGIDDQPVVRALADLLCVPPPAPAPVPPALSALVDRCLARAPEDRPATAAEVAEQLEQSAANC